MIVVDNLSQWREIRKSIDLTSTNASIGFVPTMGNLHAGHGALLQQSKQQNDLTVLSIFINPTQFNDPKDFNRYPKTLEADLQLANSLQIDYVFIPNQDMMYSDHYRYAVTEREFSTIMEGAYRPGHFDGVLTVVLKLFNLVRPTRAYFGEKDRQQLMLIDEMVKALFLDIEIVPCPTIREESGLALSSRNQFLSPEAKRLASKLHTTLKQSKAAANIHSDLSNLGFEVDYVSDYGQHRFAAVKIGGVRLIDNIQIDLG